MTKPDDVLYDRHKKVSADAVNGETFMKLIAEGAAQPKNIATVIVVMHQNKEQIRAQLRECGDLGVKLTRIGTQPSLEETLYVTRLALAQAVLQTDSSIPAPSGWRNIQMFVRGWIRAAAELLAR